MLAMLHSMLNLTECLVFCSIVPLLSLSSKTTPTLLLLPRVSCISTVVARLRLFGTPPYCALPIFCVL